MIKNIIIHSITTVLIIWYWNNSSSSTKDDMFYIYLIGSQIGFFFFSYKISKLTTELSNFKKELNE